MEMTSRVLFSLFLSICFRFPLLIKSTEDFYPDDYEFYGPTLAANDQFILAIQNRTGISFSVVSNYETSPKYCWVNYTPMDGSDLFATLIAVARNGFPGSTSGQFVFVAYSINNATTHLYMASVDFSLCQLNILYKTIMFNTTYPQYSVLGVNSNSAMAIYLSDQNIFIQKLVSPYQYLWNSPSIHMPPSNLQLLPVAMDLQDNWGVLGIYTSQNSYSSYRPYAYLLNFTDCFTYFNSSCFKFQLPSLLNYYASWQTQLAPPNTAVSNDYNSLYVMSVSINDNNNVLIGVQSMNTVFRFTASSTTLNQIGYRFLGSIPSIGFGKGVGWLDSITGAILLNNFTIDYTQWRSSNIELYPLTTSSSLSSTTPPYVSYPNARQQLWSKLNGRLINMVANPRSGVLIYMDYVGTVHVILPSLAGYFAYVEGGIGGTNTTIYLAPTIACSSGTIKTIVASGKDIFRYCLLCPEGSFYSLTSSNKTNQCTACNTTTSFCPWGAVTALPLSVLDILSQVQVYPESPESDDFEDLLLINMFSVDFATNCLLKQPLFFALTIVGIGCLVLLFMGLLKLTHKCKKHRRMIKRIFKQTDLIGEGELWIGGVASFAIMVIAAFAYRFSSAFINQYPIEKVGDATFACDPTLRNAKFSTSMQSLGTPFLEEQQPIFDMLDNQSFTLNIAFINTDFNASSLTVSQALGSISLNLSRTTTVTNGILQASTNLTSHSTTITFDVLSNSAVGAIRVGITGPSMQDSNYYVQELNFSSAFNYSNRTLTQNPFITIQLIKLINSTEPLSSNDDHQYSALWIPTFIKNDDQLFYTESDFQLYHINDQTVLTVQIAEASYYIYNQQEPITKLTQAIFTDILFTTMCIELFGLTFLFYKLAISPIIKALIGLCTDPNKVTAKGNGSGPGCPYCRSIDADTLSATRVPIQRVERDIPMYPINRQTSDIAQLQIIAAAPDMFN